MADPLGTIMIKANDSEQMIFSDFYPSVVERTRSAFPVQKDRKDALYSFLSRK